MKQLIIVRIPTSMATDQPAIELQASLNSDYFKEDYSFIVIEDDDVKSISVEYPKNYCTSLNEKIVVKVSDINNQLTQQLTKSIHKKQF